MWLCNIFYIYFMILVHWSADYWAKWFHFILLNTISPIPIKSPNSNLFDNPDCLFLHSLWATWMCCLSFLKESMCTIPCVLCWCAWQHTSVWVPDVWTVLVSKLLSLKMICQQSMSVREKILLEEVSCRYSSIPVSCKATRLMRPDFYGPLQTGFIGFHCVLVSPN